MAIRKTPEFKYDNCVSCSICVQACPAGALDLTRKGKSFRYNNLFPELVNKKCISCGLCAKSCPMDCILMVIPFEGE